MRSSRDPAFRARWAALSAVCAGLLGVLAFPPFDVWPLAFASVAGLSVAVHGRRARTGAWLGFLYGMAAFVPVLHWSGVYVGPLPWFLLAAGEAAFTAALGAALPRLQRMPIAPMWVAAAWVLAEFGRSRFPFGGFPWARWAFSQAGSPLRWFAALGGAPLLSFAVALGGTALGSALLALRRAQRAAAALAAGLLAAVPLGGLLAGLVLAPAPDRDGRTATVAVVQGNVPKAGLEIEDRQRQVLDNHVARTLALAAQVRAGTAARPDLVIWPENSSDVDPYTDPDARAEIQHAADTIGVPIVVGAILDGPGPNHVRNVGVMWHPGSGPGQTYTKRHPVPFGEYIPLRGLARMVSDKVDLVRNDMVAGSGNGLLTDGPFPIGDVICFEVAYDDLVRSSAAAGADLLVVQTNNATFGHTGEAYQQLAMTRLRAVEHGRPAVQASTTGVSAIIGPDGRIRQHTGALYTAGVITATVPLRATATLATRLGAVPEWVLCGIALAAIMTGSVISYRERRRAGVPAGEQSGSHDVDEERVRA